jgi:hypothetical protein
VLLQYQVIDYWASVWGFPEASAYARDPMPLKGVPKKLVSIVEKFRKWKTAIPFHIVEQTLESSLDGNVGSSVPLLAFRWGEDQNQLSIANEHLWFAESHSSHSDLHKI